MKRSVCISILLTGLIAVPVVADEGQPAEQTVGGIFQGVDVGGTPRRKKAAEDYTNNHRYSNRDSFAVNPALNGKNVESVSPAKHVQARQMMVPSVDDTPSTGPVPQVANQQAQPHEQTGVPAAQTLQSAGTSSADYYQSVIDQVKATGAIPPANGTGKFKVTTTDKF